jgi:hypothetical protein
MPIGDGEEPCCRSCRTSPRSARANSPSPAWRSRSRGPGHGPACTRQEPRPSFVSRSSRVRPHLGDAQPTLQLCVTSPPSSLQPRSTDAPAFDRPFRPETLIRSAVLGGTPPAVRSPGSSPRRQEHARLLGFNPEILCVVWEGLRPCDGPSDSGSGVRVPSRVLPHPVFQGGVRCLSATLTALPAAVGGCPRSRVRAPAIATISSKGSRSVAIVATCPSRSR